MSEVQNPVVGMNSNSNGNTFQLPGSSKPDALDISSSTTLQDQDHLANINSDQRGKSDAPISYFDLSQQLKEMKLDKNIEVLFCCDNVQMYFISPDGSVSSTLEPYQLIISRVYDESVDESERTFLQVDSFLFPLIPGVSPCLRTESNIFIFPDVHSKEVGAAVGIILPEAVGSDVHELFEHLLNEVSVSGRSRRSVVTDSSDSFSCKIIRGASYISHGLIKTAESAARFIDWSTPKIMTHINPNPEVQQVNPAVEKGIGLAKSMSEKAVNASDYLATRIYMASLALGRCLSHHMQNQGTKFLASTTNMTKQEASEKINLILNATSDAVEGVSTLYNGLETASGILSRSLTNNTVQIIEHKYGHPVGALTSDALTTFGNVYYTHKNFRILKPRGIAKAAVKGAGQALLEDYKHSHTNLKPHEEFQGSGPGSGDGFSAV